MDFTGEDTSSSSSSGGLPTSARIIAPRKKKVWVYTPPKTKAAPEKAKAVVAAKPAAKKKAKEKAKAIASKASPVKPAASASKGPTPASLSPVEAQLVSNPAAGPFADRRALSSIELRDLAQGSVFALETRLDQAAAKSSYGTAFVVRTDGLLLTNYHVVSQAVMDPAKYQLWLLLDKSEMPAQVVSIDVLNDLALVKVKRTFKKALPLEARRPAKGEKMFSIGLPEDTAITLVEGLFGDEQSAGFADFFVLSSPLNPGMSGGPTVDAQGRVVGVNEGMLASAQNISFIVPITHAVNLLEDSRAAIASPNSAFREPRDGQRAVQRQVASFDSGWRKSWARPKAVETREWRVRGIPGYLRCWQDKKQEKGDALETEIVRCRSLAGIPVGEGSQAGAVDFEFFSFEERSYQQVFFNLNNLREQSFGPTLRGFEERASGEGRHRRFSCRHENLKVGKGEPFLAEICLTKFNGDSPLFDTVVFLTLLDDGTKKFMARMSLNGFTREQSLFAVRRFLEAIERK